MLKLVNWCWLNNLYSPWRYSGIKFYTYIFNLREVYFFWIDKYPIFWWSLRKAESCICQEEDSTTNILGRIRSLFVFSRWPTQLWMSLLHNIFVCSHYMLTIEHVSFTHTASCWAFSAVAAIEGLTKLTTGHLISLSEQQLIDCDTQGFSHGCKYGFMDDAFNFIHRHRGLSSEQDYPYRGSEHTCEADTIKKRSHMTAIGGFEDVPRDDEDALLKAVANQPVSVAIDSSDDDFQFYSSGVFTGKCGTNYDHAVTIVGYGTTGSGTRYWLAKNSWGKGWGEDGYMKIQRSVKAKEGKCGIAMLASYPVA